jgi:hypothetical protein
MIAMFSRKGREAERKRIEMEAERERRAEWEAEIKRRAAEREAERESRAAHTKRYLDRAVQIGSQIRLEEKRKRLMEEAELRREVEAKIGRWGVEQTPSNFFLLQTGDRYEGTNVGIMGPNATGNTVNQQLWNQLQGTMDIRDLARELGALLAAMRSQENLEPEQVGAVAAAEAAAKDGDGPKALEYLRQVGGWALNMATQIGANVVASVLTKLFGLG